MSPTVRSLQKLRAEGWTAEKVERPWNPYTKRTQDLFGFADIIAFNGLETILVQTTSGDGGNLSARVKKILASDIARTWIVSDFRRIVCHGWAKRGARGKRKLWTCRVVDPFGATSQPACQR